MDFLAVRADRELGGITVGDPDLAAKCLDRTAGHGTLHDLGLLDVMGKPLMVTVITGELRALLQEGAAGESG